MDNIGNCVGLIWHDSHFPMFSYFKDTPKSIPGGDIEILSIQNKNSWGHPSSTLACTDLCHVATPHAQLFASFAAVSECSPAYPALPPFTLPGRSSCRHYTRTLFSCLRSRATKPHLPGLSKIARTWRRRSASFYDPRSGGSRGRGIDSIT